MASTFTLIAGDKQFKLALFQSPRGLRNKEKRPSVVIIESNERFDSLRLKKYIEYLQTILVSMEQQTKCLHTRRTTQFSVLFGLQVICLDCGETL